MHKRTAFLIAFASWAALSCARSVAAGVAHVDFAIGAVAAIGLDGRSRALVKGAEIQVGETVTTGQGRAQLRFADGAYMSLQPQTEFKVEAFRFSGTPSRDDSIVMSLFKGGMRTITGLIGKMNQDGYSLKTDAATIGIRGTEYTVRYTNSIEVFCAEGSIVVQNQAGTLQLDGGQGAYVASNSTAPQQTENRPVLPPESPVDRLFQEPQQRIDEPENPIQQSDQSVQEELLRSAQRGGSPDTDPSAPPTDPSTDPSTPPTDPSTDPTSPPPSETPVLSGDLSLNTAFAGYDSCGGDRCFDPILRMAGSARLDSSGKLIAFDDSGGQATHIGNGTVTDTGNDGIIAWGRWTSNQPGNGPSAGESETTRTSLHYIVGVSVPDLPALRAEGSTATYDLLGGTRPTDRNGNLGTLQGGQLVANFGAMTVNVALQVTLGGWNYNVNGTGLGISASGAFAANGLSTTGCQSNPCNTDLSGFFAGAGAVRAGVAYQINDSNQVFGTAAFAKQAPQ